jgi:hypothetical protein
MANILFVRVVESSFNNCNSNMNGWRHSFSNIPFPSKFFFCPCRSTSSSKGGRNAKKSYQTSDANLSTISMLEDKILVSLRSSCTAQLLVVLHLFRLLHSTPVIHAPRPALTLWINTPHNVWKLFFYIFELFWNINI